ncbi:CoA-disulfide reductase [Alkaliphilus peptidifermentans]|uniref:NADPH-dependent 2,4-dienoyl-CoA reductase, sulfur reductase n=1 Tax=Alkaliphilus peptidifermentans DSM 18978 TaxID=1120976 RepID=A0A1G5HCZ7_9FIRM|nr:CoA-disulfide reductase [Alkaliphilus peptidifermentans]SCY61220.1 NADPH-dependent 2,4-dienoyl-CoA reductase, sulfur reductase [Alkaliphilus peptidifermentans DSM 18978]
MKVLIVGGVAGGASTAARLRRNDENAEIIMLEKGDYVSFANCGLPYYVGKVIKSKEALLLQTPESFYNRFHIDVRVRSEVFSVNYAKKTVSVRNCETGESYIESYDKLVLSPGAKPIIPKIKGMDLKHVFTLRNIPDAFAIEEFIIHNKTKSCAVIGGGFIGLEMAENLKSSGLEVSVIEAGSHVMPSIDTDMAYDVQNYIRSKGIKLYLNSRAQEITNSSVIFENGIEVAADMIIMSIGITPDTEFLKDSHILLGERGEILVNDYMETSVNDIFALGDAVSIKNIISGQRVLIPLASPANKQGRIVADNLCGKNQKYNGSQGTSIIKLFEMTVASTGEKEESLIRNNIPYKKVFTYSSSHAGYYPDGKMMSLKLLFSPLDGKILAVQIVGYDGVDKRIDVLANAVRFGLTVYDLQEMELAYAPPFSSAKDPVNMLGYVASNVLDGKMKVFYLEDISSLPKEAILIDVRTVEEFENGHINGAVNIPLDSLRSCLNALDKNKVIYLTCQIGLRGYIAQRILDQKGYSSFNLSGGYRLYRAAEINKAGLL